MALASPLERRDAPEIPAIELRDVWKVFGPDAPRSLQAVRERGLGKGEALSELGVVVGVAGVSFAVQPGEIFCVMGLSGSGKSTLVRHINGLILPTAGQVLIEGDDLGAKSAKEIRRLRAEKIGMVFQNFALMPHRSVLDNVAFGLELREVGRDRRLERAQEMLELVQLGAWGDRWPDELSGGMQQRVGLARALAGDPDILLMDEPFGALDPLIRRQLQDQFLELTRRVRKTTVFITHDLDEAMRFGSRIAIMRDGRVVQLGTPGEIVRAPADAYVADFVSGLSRLKAVRAADILRPLAPAELAALPADWPRAPLDSDLDRLAGLAGEGLATVVVTDGAGEPVGLIGPELLLRAIHGRKSDG